MTRPQLVLRPFAASLLALVSAALPGLAVPAPGPHAQVTATEAPALVEETTAPPVAPMERPYIWRIEGATPSYLFGTIHLPDPRVNALAPSVEAALEAADVLVTEIHLAPEERQALASAVLLSGDDTLQSLLPEALFARASVFLGERGLPIAALGKLKIWALATQVGLLDYLPQMMMMEPLDVMLYSRASEAGARTEGLETVEEQMQIFDSLTVEEQIEMLRKALDQVEAAAAEGTSPARDLVDAYLAGDENALLDKVTESIDPGDESEAALLDRILDQRNHRMAERIAARLEAEPETTWFFAVGAGHVAGDEGVVALLAGRGLELVRLPGAPDAPRDAGDPASAPAAPGIPDKAAPAGAR